MTTKRTHIEPRRRRRHQVAGSRTEVAGARTGDAAERSGESRRPSPTPRSAPDSSSGGESLDAGVDTLPDDERLDRAPGMPASGGDEQAADAPDESAGELSESDLADADDGEVQLEAGTEQTSGRRYGRFRRGIGKLRPRRTRSLIAVVVVSVLAGTGLSLWFHGEEQAIRTAPQARNTAVVDEAATKRVASTVSATLEKLWSYDYRKLDQHGETVKSLTTKSFMADYSAQFERIKKLAPKQKAVVSAQVIEIAVRTLHGDRAELVAFLNQQATKEGAEKETRAASRLRVEAVRVGDRWLVSKVAPV